MNDELITLKIDDILVGERHRKEFGDITSLAKSISEHGLLQPIGVTPDNRLVFGERRLRALKYLGQRTVLARVVQLDSLLVGELAENEHRLDFTPSERAGIADAILAELGSRQGHRSDRELRGNCAEVDRGERTRDIVAVRAGFANATEHARVKLVIESGTPELVEAMDAGTASISAAALLVTLPPEEQQAVVAAGPKAIKQVATAARAKKKLKPAKEGESVTAAEVARLRQQLVDLAKLALNTIITNCAEDEFEDNNDELADALAKIFDMQGTFDAACPYGIFNQTNAITRAYKVVYMLLAGSVEIIEDAAVLGEQMSCAACSNGDQSVSDDNTLTK